MNNAEWFVDWFNSPYYHLLYNNRNFNEAHFFIDNLCNNLDLQPAAKLWDLACGKGRHAIALNEKGFDVTGSDLSENSIHEASQYSNDTLHFFVHDMRLPFREHYFDAVFNLFTSFGYFSNVKDNFLVFKNVAAALKKHGCFVIDFLNSEKICESSFLPQYVEKRGDITFTIRKKIVDNAIHKRIEFSDAGKHYYFEETVSLLRKEDFESYAKAADLSLCETFGNYLLEPFDERHSDRLILIFKK